MEKPLSGWRAKFARAGAHLQAFNAAVDQFLAGQGDTLTVRWEPDSEPSYYCARISFVPEPPDDWGLMLGDAIHNLRSALDHALWAVPRLGGEAPYKHSQFPICTTVEAWEGDTTRKTLRQLPLGLVAYIADIQPYTRPHPERLVISRLAALDNEDKHRIVQTTVFGMDDFRLDPDPLESGIAHHLEWYRGLPLKVGNKLCRARFHAVPKPQDQVQANVTVDVKFSDGVSVGEAMADFLRAVADMVQMIEFCIQWAP